VKSEPPVPWKQTKMDKFLNLFICLYRYLTEKFVWPRNYAVYAELTDLGLIDKEKQKPNRKVWYTGDFVGTIESEQPYPMSKRRAERIVSSFSGGATMQISPDPPWFRIIQFVFGLFPLPIPIRFWFSFRKPFSRFTRELKYSFLVERLKGANLEKERPILLGAEVIQNQLLLLYDRELNIEKFPPFSDFLVLVRGEERKVNVVGYAGTRKDFPDIVRLMLITSVNAGEEVRIYYAPRKECIEDSKGNSAQGFKNVLVRNSTK